MPDYVAIFDSVAYYKEGEEEVTRVDRGSVIKDPAKGEIDRLRDKEIFYPYGAIAKKGSPLGDELSKAVPTDEDPVKLRFRLDALASSGSRAKAEEPAPETESFSPQT